MSDSPAYDSKYKVSVIVATYNSEQYLEQCILSILQQTYSNYELLIIDGGSTDKTTSIIKKYAQYIAYWTSESDKGIYDAWNKAIDKATGDWFTFIGSDDLFYPNALEIYIKHILGSPNQHTLEFVSSRIDLVDENLCLLDVVGAQWDWKSFKKSMVTWHVGCFHSRKLFSKYGLFDVSFKISGDYELLLRAKELLITSFVGERTAKMRNSGVSSSRLVEASHETYRAKIRNGVLSPLKGNLLRLVDKIRLIYRSYKKVIE